MNDICTIFRDVAITPLRNCRVKSTGWGVRSLPALQWVVADSRGKSAHWCVRRAIGKFPPPLKMFRVLNLHPVHIVLERVVIKFCSNQPTVHFSSFISYHPQNPSPRRVGGSGTQHLECIIHYLPYRQNIPWGVFV